MYIKLEIRSSISVDGAHVPIVCKTRHCVSSDIRYSRKHNCDCLLERDYKGLGNNGSLSRDV